MIKYRIVQLKSGMWKVQRRYFYFLWLYDLELFANSLYETSITLHNYKECLKDLEKHIRDKDKDRITKVVGYNND